MDENKFTETQGQDKEQATALSTAQTGKAPIIWSDAKSMNAAWRTATMLSKSDLLPDTYRGRPENVLIALDLALRMNVSPMLIAQQLYIVKGKPAWSGQFCISQVNGSGRFTPLEFVLGGDGGTETASCYAQATRLSDGKLCTGTKITMQMAKAEGWTDKNGSKWKTMPQQMLQYRAATFFARVFCPDLLMGLQTADEIRDTYGADKADKPVVTYEL